MHSTNRLVTSGVFINERGAKTGGTLLAHPPRRRRSRCFKGESINFENSAEPNAPEPNDVSFVRIFPLAAERSAYLG